MEPTTAALRQRERRFRQLYDAAYVDLLRFVSRRVHPSHAEDVVGEVMLVAWRRLDDVPSELSDAAWPLLSATDREAIALSVLDGLTAPEAAMVLSISATAFRLRLSRARRTLRRHVDSPAAADDELSRRDPASERSPR